MGNSTEKIRSLIDSVDSGKLLVPEMQRRSSLHSGNSNE